jgi:hypothetical protein
LSVPVFEAVSITAKTQTAPARSEKGEAKPEHDTPVGASFKTTVFAGLAHRFLWHLNEPSVKDRQAKAFQFAPEQKIYTIGLVRD